MHDRPVTRGEHPRRGPRRDHGHRARVRGHTVPVATRRPGQQPAVPHQERRTAGRDHHPVRQLRQRGGIGTPHPGPNEPVGVQPRVDLRHPGHATPERGRPATLESLVIAVPALAARPVPGRQPGRLVQEVQLGEPPRRPLLPAPALELQDADGPGPSARVADDPSRGIVQRTAVPPEQPAIRDRDQLTVRGHPVLPRHRRPPPFIDLTSRRACARFALLATPPRPHPLACRAPPGRTARSPRRCRASRRSRTARRAGRTGRG